MISNPPDSAQATTGLLSHRPDNSPKLIVYSNLHHRDTDSQLKSNTSKFVRILSSKEDVYIRKMTVGEQWIQLDTAWIKPDQIGYLRIRNEGGRVFNVQPTPEQVEEEKLRIVDIGYMLVNTHPEKKEEIPTIKTKRTMFDPPLKVEPQIVVEPIPMWMVHPHEHMEGKPHPMFPMFLRCRHGEVSVTVVAVPN